ncbi:unnamed protein product [Protopolystoma xenopodis]|uniref:Uncharacterized protein n=1 Tax=Protopolystoma xenopodis TaxID=117903 RepID=A0A448WF60_9PLAT|nr:unnamed protein product [Protopolystoma xenopodis]
MCMHNHLPARHTHKHAYTHVPTCRFYFTEHRHGCSTGREQEGRRKIRPIVWTNVLAQPSHLLDKTRRADVTGSTFQSWNGFQASASQPLGQDLATGAVASKRPAPYLDARMNRVGKQMLKWREEEMQEGGPEGEEEVQEAEEEEEEYDEEEDEEDEEDQEQEDGLVGERGWAEKKAPLMRLLHNARDVDFSSAQTRSLNLVDSDKMKTSVKIAFKESTRPGASFASYSTLSDGTFELKTPPCNKVAQDGQTEVSASGEFDESVWNFANTITWDTSSQFLRHNPASGLLQRSSTQTGEIFQTCG